MTHVACRLTAKNRDQLRNPTLGNREYGLLPRPGHAQAGYASSENRQAAGAVADLE